MTEVSQATEVKHPFDGHHLAYLVLAGDMVLHSELVPARELLEFPSFDIPPQVRQVEVMITLYGEGGVHISIMRRTLHPKAVKAALNALPWKMLEDYMDIPLALISPEPR